MEVVSDTRTVFMKKQPSAYLLAFGHVAHSRDRLQLSVDRDRVQADLDGEHVAVAMLGKQTQIGAHRPSLGMFCVPTPVSDMAVSLLIGHEVIDQTTHQAVRVAAVMVVSEHARCRPVGQHDAAIRATRRVHLPDALLDEVLGAEAAAGLKDSGFGIYSITVVGYKESEAP